VVEDEPIIALQLEAQLNAAGARVYSAGRLRDALYLAEHPALSAAVLDYRLGGDDSAAVCRRLADLGVPFVFYTGFSDAGAFRHWPAAPVVSKPVEGRVLIDAVARLLN
jgi:DNA-binding response OmpR family regulator